MTSAGGAALSGTTEGINYGGLGAACAAAHLREWLPLFLPRHRAHERSSFGVINQLSDRHGGALSRRRVQDSFAQTKRFWRGLNVFIGINVLDCALETHL